MKLIKLLLCLFLVLPTVAQGVFQGTLGQKGDFRVAGVPFLWDGDTNFGANPELIILYCFATTNTEVSCHEAGSATAYASGGASRKFVLLASRWYAAFTSTAAASQGYLIACSNDLGSGAGGSCADQVDFFDGATAGGFLMHSTTAGHEGIEVQHRWEIANSDTANKIGIGAPNGTAHTLAILFGYEVDE